MFTNTTLIKTLSVHYSNGLIRIHKIIIDKNLKSDLLFSKHSPFKVKHPESVQPILSPRVSVKLAQNYCLTQNQFQQLKVIGQLCRYVTVSWKVGFIV